MQSSIFLLFLGCLVGGFHSTHVVAAGSITANPRVLIMGDSLSAAHNISIEQSWPVLFAQKLQQMNPPGQVINASISGETTAGGLERLQKLLARHRSSHLILELGGNDGLRGYKFKQTRQNLQSMIDMAQQMGVQVLLIGVRLPPNLGPVYNQRFQQIYAQLAANAAVAYLPRFLEGIAADREDYMQQDGIHPTALAQPLLAEKVYRVFRDAYYSP